jgi:hypothetical protein
MAPGASWKRGSLLVIGVVAVSLLLGLAVVRSLVAERSPGPGWVRVGSVEDVRSQGVVALPEVPAYVVVDPPRTPIALLARSTHLGERIIYCRSSGWFEDPAHGTKVRPAGQLRTRPCSARPRSARNASAGRRRLGEPKRGHAWAAARITRHQANRSLLFHVAPVSTQAPSLGA